MLCACHFALTTVEVGKEFLDFPWLFDVCKLLEDEHVLERVCSQDREVRDGLANLTQRVGKLLPVGMHEVHID